jgi:DNA-directed RNA polymerase specialized sigma24 family protein
MATENTVELRGAFDHRLVLSGCFGRRLRFRQQLSGRLRYFLNAAVGRSVGKKKSGSSSKGGADALPLTDTAVLAAAADGHWKPFFRAYLQPCWREVVIASRRHGIRLADPDDLYQELMLRVIRDAGFGHRVKQALAANDEDPEARGNLLGRYLKYRELPLPTARFRTYLKTVIRNLIRKVVRTERRQPRKLDTHHRIVLEPWIEESLTCYLDRQWIIDCLTEVVWQVHRESTSAHTRGKARWFGVLYRSTVKGESPRVTALEYQVDRSTISASLTEARGRFVDCLREVAGITNLDELGDLLADMVDELKTALIRVHDDCSHQTPARADANGIT